MRWCNLLTDIDDRKRAETELKFAYDSIADAQRLSRTGSFVVDPQADDHTWSDEAYRIFEFDPATKITRQRVRDAVYPDDLHKLEGVYAHYSEGEDITFEYRIVTASGAMKHLRGLEHLVERKGRRLFIGAIQDITDIKQSDAALKASEKELRQAHNFLTEAQRLSQTGSFTWDALADEERWSDEVYRIFDLNPATTIKLSLIRQLVHPEDLPLLEATVERGMAGLDMDLTARIVTPRGALKYVHVVSHRIEHIVDRPVFIGAVQDVTETKLAEETANRALGPETCPHGTGFGAQRPDRFHRP